MGGDAKDTSTLISRRELSASAVVRRNADMVAAVYPSYGNMLNLLPQCSGRYLRLQVLQHASSRECTPSKDKLSIRHTSNYRVRHA